MKKKIAIMLTLILAAGTFTACTAEEKVNNDIKASVAVILIIEPDMMPDTINKSSGMLMYTLFSMVNNILLYNFIHFSCLVCIKKVELIRL